MLLHMYKKTQYKQNGNSSDKELIDISSDDDVSKDNSKNKKDVKTLESGCTVTKESLNVSSMIASKPETATTKLETIITEQETAAAKPEMSTSKPETPVKPKIVCICM